MIDSTFKQQAMDLVATLSEDASWDELMHKIYVRQAIEAGIADADAGRVIEVSEVRKQFGLQP